MAATDLTGAIIDRWAGKTTLNGLLASTSVFAGTQQTTDPPYATVRRISTDVHMRTSQGRRVDRVRIEIKVRHTDYDLLRGIVNELTQVTTLGGFDRDEWTFDTDQVVGAMYFVGDADEEDSEKGLWISTVLFDVILNTKLA